MNFVKNNFFLTVAICFITILFITHCAKPDYFHQALEAYDNGNDTMAIELFDEAIKNNQSPDTAHYKRGNSYNNMNQMSLALIDYGIALTLNPEYSKAWFNRAATYYRIGDCKSSINDYRMVIKLIPDDVRGYYGLGLSSLILNDFEETIIQMTKAIELDSNYYDAYVSRADAYIGIEKFDIAIVDLQKAMDIDSINPMAISNSSIVYSMMGDTLSEKKMIEKLTVIKKSHKTKKVTRM